MKYGNKIMQNIHRKYMREAIKMSLKSTEKDMTGGPFGTVIVKDGKIIARGRNMVLKNCDPTAHGEITTIRLACKKLKTFDLSGCDLYTNCEPCPMCLMACRWANIRNIYFAATRKTAAEIGFRDDFLYQMLKSGVKTGIHLSDMEQEAVAAMHKWKEQFSQVNY